MRLNWEGIVQGHLSNQKREEECPTYKKLHITPILNSKLPETNTHRGRWDKAVHCIQSNGIRLLRCDANVIIYHFEFWYFHHGRDLKLFSKTQLLHSA
jgi:hypothetical protein